MQFSKKSSIGYQKCQEGNFFENLKIYIIANSGNCLHSLHSIHFLGIKKGVVAVPSRFTVDTKNAGPGDLSVAVEGPSKVDIDCVDNGDGTCEVTYVPVEAGMLFF